ncbi:MAG: adenylate/guanylate cyclase domain-containing protein, partial [Fimbriimonadaceae bacterium]|nr:adenylate/guanylate cyclase domain-containing protein [Alphaproteobacteria bacterium]
TYLGKDAGTRVLSGAIRRGDGSKINAVVWYSDLRDSTAMADTMPSEDFLHLLNVYFECSAGPAIKAGGEILDFIGDGVLAIFPYENEADLPAAVCAASRAVRQSKIITDQINDERQTAGLPAIRFGIGLNVGSVMFGNIGVPERLSFSVIGPTVNEVARIEKMTKALDTNILVTAEIAAVEPESWQSIGHQRLDGVAQQIELFELLDTAQSAIPVEPGERMISRQTPLS